MTKYRASCVATPGRCWLPRCTHGGMPTGSCGQSTSSWNANQTESGWDGPWCRWIWINRHGRQLAPLWDTFARNSGESMCTCKTALGSLLAWRGHVLWSIADAEPLGIRVSRPNCRHVNWRILVPDLPAGWAGLFGKLVAKDPGDRFPTAQAALDCLDAMTDPRDEQALLQYRVAAAQHVGVGKVLRNPNNQDRSLFWLPGRYFGGGRPWRVRRVRCLPTHFLRRRSSADKSALLGAVSDGISTVDSGEFAAEAIAEGILDYAWPNKGIRPPATRGVACRAYSITRIGMSGTSHRRWQSEERSDTKAAFLDAEVRIPRRPWPRFYWASTAGRWRASATVASTCCAMEYSINSPSMATSLPVYLEQRRGHRTKFGARKLEGTDKLDRPVRSGRIPPTTASYHSRSTSGRFSRRPASGASRYGPNCGRRLLLLLGRCQRLRGLVEDRPGVRPWSNTRPAEACRHLVNAANSCGGADNIGCVVIRIDTDRSQKKPTT